ncbi:MAG: dihydroxyacetone kinase subunit L [Dermabacter sp.]|nr:dihydroxyacetone kinase subunit L [Dermabacter sp.]
MLTPTLLARITAATSDLMRENRDYLVKLDQVNGDGDLGISMDDGFRALRDYLGADGGETATDDLGQLLRGGAKVLNASAPSSLGTILSFGLMGMAKALRGVPAASVEQSVAALEAGIATIMTKAESAPGEKTILDALVPGVQALRAGVDAGAGHGAGSDGAGGDAAGADPADVGGAGMAEVNVVELARRAADAAAAGSESTRQMEAVHGRAAYSASRSIGVLDGGSVVGALIFEGIARGVADAADADDAPDAPDVASAPDAADSLDAD